MAEKNQQTYASANGYSRSNDQESSPLQSDEERKRQKRIKLFIYIGIFILFQIVMGVVFRLTVMKLKNPKVTWGEINVESLNFSPAKPSFDTSFATQIRIKNTNWGPYKFDAGSATFLYQGVNIGKVDIPKSKAGMKSTKKFDVEVSLNSSALPSGTKLGSELSSGVLTLTSYFELKGRVELMMIMKYTKNVYMDCTVAFDLASKTAKTLECK